MAEQTLREAAADIRQLIDEGRAGEAIPRVQALLRRHPRYIHGYRLLAEAALEQGYTRDAIELFRRVLSADPENFAAHAGLATAYAEENVLDEALWHMTRAFEVQPGLREVRQRLRDLYELRDGRAPGRLHLTRAALARGYLRDGLPGRAVPELEAEMAAERDRVDLLSALAEAQWHDGQRHLAVEAAMELLRELPFALKANLLVGQFYAAEGEPEAAAPFLRVAQELDPENEWAARLFGDLSVLEPLSLALGSPDEGWPGGRPAAEEARLPQWLADLSLFNTPTPPDEAVDWDAIVAHESDWRTQLAAATRDAVARFAPDWRTDLRRATRAALKARPAPTAPVAPVALAPSEREPAALAPEPVEPAPVAAFAPEAPEPMAERSLEVDTESVPAYDALEPAIPVQPLPAALWLSPLAEATRAALAEYAEAATQPAALGERTLDGAQPPLPGTLDVQPLPPAVWTADLAEATRAALATGEQAAPEALSWDELAAESRAAVTAEPTPAWADTLADATRAELAAPTLPAWVSDLQRTTQSALAEPRPTPLPEAGWAIALRNATDEWLAAPAPESAAPALDLPAAPAAVAASAWATQLRRETAAALAERYAADRSATDRDDEAGLAARLAEGATDVIQRVQGLAGTLRRRITDTLTPLLNRDVTPDAEPSAPRPPVDDPLREMAQGYWDSAAWESAPPAEPVSEPATAAPAADLARGVDEDGNAALASQSRVAPDMAPALPDEGLAEGEAPPLALEGRAEAPASEGRAGPPAPTTSTGAVSAPEAPRDDLTLAREAWQGGEGKEALAIFQRLLYEGDVADEALSEALLAWTASNTAPPLAYQLLGDVYRRMGLMREAVAQYREAINRM